MVFDNPATSIGHIRAGKLRALAVSGRARTTQLPDVPTVAEAGLPGFEINSWFGVLAPANLPGPVAERLNAGFAKAVRDPEVRDRLQQQGFTPVGGTVDQFAAFLRADIANWKRIIETSGARIE